MELVSLARNALFPSSIRFSLDYSGGDSNPIAAIIHDHCPSLTGVNTATTTRYLANGHLQTLYSALGDFSNTDHIQYSRCVLLTPDGGTLAIDIGVWDTIREP